MTRMVMLGGVLALVVVASACSGPIRVAPRWRIEVRENGAPVPGVAAVESSRHTDCEATRHSVTAISNAEGLIEFPERTLDHANCKEPFAEGRRQSVRETPEHGPDVYVIVRVLQPGGQFPPMLELPPVRKDGIAFTAVTLQPGWKHVTPGREVGGQNRGGRK